MDGVVAVVAGVLVVLGLGSGVLARSVLSAPIVVLGAGMLFGPGLGVLPTELTSGGVLVLAQLSLAVLLFVDATRVDLSLVRRNGQVPARMLLLGLPLTIGLGTLVGSAVLGIGLGGAFVLACLLAPTDAALGQAVMTDERVPQRIRQALNVESGLNDGLAVPFLAVALVVVEARSGDLGAGAVLLEVARLIGGAVAVGALVGGAVGAVLQRVGWRTLEPASRQIGVAAVPVLAFGLAGLAGGNGFVAAFVAGVAFAATFDDAHPLVELAEDVGEGLSLLTFLVFGAVFTAPAAEAIGWRVVVYVLLSLTVVRMLPIVGSLLGLRLRPATIGMLGWFGPRGLATIVFGLEVLELAEEGSYALGEELFGIAAVAVVASVVLHGLSARPLTAAYARRIAAMADEPDMPEMAEVEPLPVRRSGGRAG
jgi:NhaP-type Na+/H+ or K+/H+ antiporter